MNAYNQLIQSVLEGKSDKALYFTCILIKNGRTHDLEDAWIELSGRIGAKQYMPFRETWQAVNINLVKLIAEEQMHIRDALHMTAMLYILYHRDSAVSGNGGGAALRGTQNVATLRKQILEHFPEDAMLSYSGASLFRKIIPPSAADSYMFVHRVLAGFMRLFEQQAYSDIHKSLEYMSRRKIALPMPFVWPAPTVDLAEKGDPIWFLWGMVLLHFTNDNYVATLWHLYMHQWRASVKPARAGLLWGVAHVMDNSIGFVWTREELNILENVKGVAGDLWAHVRESEGDDGVASANAKNNRRVAATRARDDDRRDEDEWEQWDARRDAGRDIGDDWDERQESSAVSALSGGFKEINVATKTSQNVQKTNAKKKNVEKSEHNYDALDMLFDICPRGTQKTPTPVAASSNRYGYDRGRRYEEPSEAPAPIKILRISNAKTKGELH